MHKNRLFHGIKEMALSMRLLTTEFYNELVTIRQEGGRYYIFQNFKEAGTIHLVRWNCSPSEKWLERGMKDWAVTSRAGAA